MDARSRAVLAEIGEKCASAPSQRVVRMVKTLLAQYAAQAPLCSAEQLELYDEALLALVKCLDAAGKAEIAYPLAQTPGGPRSTLRFLADNPDIDIAGPVLRNAAFEDSFLEATAHSKDGARLMALATRSVLSSAVSTLLIESGISYVIAETVRNEGAVLTEMAFSLLIGLAAKDPELACLIAGRKDIPEELRSFVDLILQ